MTATFNDTLLILLQHMTGLSIQKPSLYWSHSTTFGRRNINMTVSFSKYQTRIIKEVIKSHLGNDLTSKAIVYCSVAKSTEKIQETLDAWLDDPTNIDGDTILFHVNNMQESLALLIRLLFEEQGSNLGSSRDTYEPYLP
jgi:hypothetical protein